MECEENRHIAELTPPALAKSADHDSGSIMIAEIENLQILYGKLEKKLDYYEKAAKESREAELLSNAKCLRQTELLQDALDSADAALKQNCELREGLNRIEEGLLQVDLSDEEANQKTNQLYQGLEDWIKHHYEASQLSNPATDSDIDSCQPRIAWWNIYADLSHQIFHVVLSRFMVGTGNPGMNHALRMLDEKVHDICPRHIGQYWRFGTSRAALALAKPELEVTLDHIVQSIETRYSHNAISNSFAERKRELKALLWEFVSWKSRLERQIGLFYFWWIVPGLPFRTEYMNSLTGEDKLMPIVERGLSPILYRLLPDGSEPTLVRRGLVQITSQPTINGGQSQNGFKEKI
ncbi:hypothetical protein N7454_009113 [Penicillium verhagenii]|nr:hypothetical protein N7454_009113 [Penicillium verhagenii]